MTQVNLGRIAIIPQGTWTAGTYKALDLVRYNGKSYIAKATTTATPTNTTYWDLVASDGADGSAGPQGPAGTNGVDGATLYTWIKYADDAVGAGLSDFPTGKSYIGIAVNKISATESTTVSDYAWSLLSGGGDAGVNVDGGNSLSTYGGTTNINGGASI